MENTIYYFDPYKSYSTTSYWELDKPTLIGESQGNSANHTTSDELYNGFIHNWAGVLFWSYTASADSMGCFSDFDDALLAFRNTDPSLINFNTSSCIATDIESSSTENAINIFPNPASNEIQVISEQSKVNSIEIFNLLGEKMYSLQITDNHSPITINLENIPNEVYVIEVNMEEGIEVRKFVKE
jgi:hypothetical protein